MQIPERTCIISILIDSGEKANSAWRKVMCREWERGSVMVRIYRLDRSRCTSSGSRSALWSRDTPHCRCWKVQARPRKYLTWGPQGSWLHSVRAAGWQKLRPQRSGVALQPFTVLSQRRDLHGRPFKFEIQAGGWPSTTQRIAKSIVWPIISKRESVLIREASALWGFEHACCSKARRASKRILANAVTLCTSRFTCVCVQ